MSADDIITQLLEADDDFMDMKDFGPGTDYQQLIDLIEGGYLSLTGNVSRSDHHYVHENTTNVELREDWNWNESGSEEERQQRVALEMQVGELINRLDEDITANMRKWNKKIYRELESAYEGDTSDEAVAETILANNYLFDEDGSRTEAGGALTYDELTPEAQEQARQWYVQSIADSGDTYYAEPVIAEWRWLLANKGFTDVKINWSGFWSQGDGASFTADHIDVVKYLHGPDPLTFPESERDQLNEAREDDLESDPKDVYRPPPRRDIKDVKTKADYAEYQERLAEFFAREGITNLSSVGDNVFFSWKPCDCCRRKLGGNRTAANGYNPQTREILNFEVCEDCLYYAEYGHLDDTTMMDMKDDPIEERHGGAEKEKSIWYHGTSASLIPKILSQGLITNPKQRAWHEDPHVSVVQATRKSLPGSIYVTTNLGTATLSAQKVAQRDKAHQAVVVMELQPRTMVADEDDVTHSIKSIESHLSDSSYHHIWPYFMEVYGSQLTNAGADDYRKDFLGIKQKWVNRVAQQLLYAFGDKVRPELEKRVKELLFSEGFRVMLTRMVSYIKHNWDLSHWRKFWSEGFGDYESAPEIPNSAEAEAEWLAFSDKLSRTLKDKARPSKSAEGWRFRDTGRLLSNVGYQGTNHIICVLERLDAKEPEWHSRMIIHYGKPPPKLISDWEQNIGKLDQPGDIVYKNKPTTEAMDDDFEIKDVLGTPPPPPTFTVSSSWGDFTAYIEDGKIISRSLDDLNVEEDPDSAEYYDILQRADRFDVEEWQRRYPDEKIEPGWHIDIQDFGIFTKDGLYDPPDEQWRNDFQAQRHN